MTPRAKLMSKEGADKMLVFVIILMTMLLVGFMMHQCSHEAMSLK